MTSTLPVLELRVHGVSNTPPEDLLGPGPAADCQPADRHRLCRVAGDELTGFYRRADAPPDSPVEAYSWGQLTSGVRERGARIRKDLYRALWTLLLPFALANLALHARTDIRGRVTAYLVRLFGLTVTATVVVAATTVGVDLVAWQCVDDTCLARIPGSWTFLADGFWHGAGRAALVGLAAPVALVSVIGFVAWRSFRYEAELPDAPDPDRGGSDNPLRDPHCWRGYHQVRGLLGIHLGTALAVAAAVPVIGILHVDRPQGWAAWLGWVTVVLLAATLLLAIAALAHPTVTVRGYATSEATGWTAAWQRVPSPVRWPGVAALVSTAALLLATGRDELERWRPPAGCLDPPRGELPAGCYEDRSLPLLDQLLTGLGAAQLALLVLLAVLAGTGYARRQRPRVPDRYARQSWFGTGPAVFALLGWALGVAYASGMVYWVTNRINLGATPTGRSIITPPTPLLWTSLAFLVMLLAVLVTGMVLGCRYAYLRRWSRRRIWRDPRFEPELRHSAHARRRAHTVASWYGLHHLVERDALRAVGVLAAVAALLAGLGVTASLVDIWPGARCWWENDFACRPPQESHGWVSTVVKGMTDVGGWVAGVVPVLVAGVAGLTYRSHRVRRAIGVIWDVGAFWPRSAHPFAPPSYAEAAVPQLLTRTSHLLAGGRASGVIFSGHSQGALLCLATILQLPEQTLPRIRLVTHGCQLSRLYGRVFPAYTGPDQLAAISTWLGHDRPDRWTNFWRETDPLGYQVRNDNRAIRISEHRLGDPVALRPSGGEVLPPPIRNHSGYPYDLLYQDHCRRIRKRLATLTR